jgi:hypothetical protein
MCRQFQYALSAIYATWIQHTPTRTKDMRNTRTIPTGYKETAGGEAQNPLFLREKEAFWPKVWIFAVKS